MLRNKYFAIFLSIVAIIVVYFSFGKGFIMKKHAKTTTQKPSQIVEKKYEATARDDMDLNNPFKIEQIFYNPDEEWGRDPFMRVSKEEIEKAMPEELPKLTAILRSKNRVFAVLNGKTVKEGERINGIFVKKILEDSVIIDRGAGDEYVYIFNLPEGGRLERKK